MSSSTANTDASAALTGGGGEGRDFIRTIVARDLEQGTHDGRVVTRFPPEPNGYLHIGHAKSIVLNFGIAEEVPGGVCHLRFDDTNPETEDPRYVEAIREDVSWLGYDPGEHLYFASDYFERLYRFAEHLIREGEAYVDSQSDEEIRERRGTVTEPGTPSPYRDRPAEESLDLFRRMRAGEFPNGAHVLRARIDMASPNMLMRDPVLYRIRHASHYRTGDEWCIYPLYDYAHPLEDAIECVTHSLCTLEFEINRPLYDWSVERWQSYPADHEAPPDGSAAGAEMPGDMTRCRPRQYEFARLNLDYTVMSKRKLLSLVEAGHVAGWDDPRMPTIAGLRRRGVRPEAIRAFCDMIGVAKTESRVDIGKLEFTIRDDLNTTSPRVLCVLRPLRVVITNYPEDDGAKRTPGEEQTEELDAPSWPHDVPKEGSRPLPFSREIFIEREDFAEEPPKDWRRLAPGREVRLRHAYFIRCKEVVRNDDGEVSELRCTYDPATRGGAAPDGRRPSGTIHWVSARHALRCEVRLYDRLFRVPDPEAAATAEESAEFTDFLNPDSLEVLTNARIEPSVREHPPGTRYQLERQGYFMSDPLDSSADAPVFNRTAMLRDTWTRKTQQEEEGTAGREHPGRTTPGERDEPEKLTPEEQERRRREAAPERSPELEATRRRFMEELGLSEDDAEILTRERATADFVEAAFASGAEPQKIANWAVNELPREIGDRPIENLAIGGADFGALVELVEDGTLSTRAGREVLAEMVEKGETAPAIVERRGLTQISDAEKLSPLVEEAIESDPAKAAEYREGREALIGYFMGRVMRASRGKANPELARKLLEKRLAEGPPYSG